MSHEPDRLRRRLLLAGLTLGLVTPVQARDALRAAAGELPQDEAAQVHDLLATGSLALQTSTLALQRSSNPDVRAFARSEIAEQRGISAAITGSTRPLPVDARGAPILAEAGSLPGGPAFDQVYVRRQIEGHEQLDELARDYADDGSDPRIVAVARGALPLIGQHLATLRRLDQGLAG